MTDAEIAGYMGWRGPGVYTQHQMRRVKALIAEVVMREREACAKLVEQNADKFLDEISAAIRARSQA